MKTFDIATQTVPATEYSYASDAQRERGLNCDRVFKFRYINGPVGCLPKYVKDAIAEAGYKAEVIGSSTYKYTLIGLTKVLRESDLEVTFHTLGNSWSIRAVVGGCQCGHAYFNCTRDEAIERFLKHYGEGK